MDIISYKQVETKILVLRKQNVILDRDVAELYGVSTREINQAVKNNPGKFPQGYILSLDNKEKNELVKNFDRFNTLKHSTSSPYAFTEKGLYMLATILKNPTATEMTIAFVETFTRLRELTRSIHELSTTADKNRQKALMRKTGELLEDIMDDGALEVSADETFEINLALVKLKHTVKRGRKDNKSD